MDADVIDRLGQASVLVVGDVLLDRFVAGPVSRISREAPVPVLKKETVRDRPGGACNVAANVLAYGGAATLVGLVGVDAAAGTLDALCSAFPRLTRHLIPDSGRPTTVKTRYLSGWQQLLCVDTEESHAADPDISARLVAAAGTAIADSGAVVLSDYGRGALDPGSIAALIAAARAAGKPVVVDPRHADPGVYAGATVLTPNREEMRAFSGVDAGDDTAAVAACRQVLSDAAIDAVLLTRGTDGMTLVAHGRPPLHVRAETHRVFDVTGAGDTVVATLAAALAVGVELVDAVRLANTAAGIVVAKPGTATVDPNELGQGLGTALGDGVLDAAAAADQVAAWREQGLRVGFTNGCFDLLHRGHLYSLEQAAKRADRLVVGLNADASAQKLKGAGRPVQDEVTRAAVLAMSRFVDLVVIFAEDTPERLIQALRPDLLFKGADYAGQEIPGAAFVTANGGAVEFLPLLEGYSTTATVARTRGDAEK